MRLWPSTARQWPTEVGRQWPDAPWRPVTGNINGNPLDYGSWLAEDGTELYTEGADATWLIDGTIEPNGFWTNDQGDIWLTSDGWQWATSDGSGSVPQEEDLAPRTYLALTGVQSIANNTATNVQWTVASDDVGAFNASSAGMWVVPSGYSKMKVLFRGNWASNNTGARWAYVQNSGSSKSDGHIYQAAFESSFEMPTKYFNVSSGEQWFAQVQQASGSSLNFNSGSYGGAYIEITWLP